MLAAPMALSGLRLRKWLPPSRRIAGASSWEATDWAKIVGLYDMLLPVWPSPIVALNRAVADGFADGPEAGLANLEALATEPLLASYYYLAGARGNFLRCLGRV